ncbi:uncharacterized protein LOC106153615 [Lingula anatina]|uniref:Uncharacterized protein LOC106153615 n=1 Tax=Lingula anatina TaxID=7574 RepID=A0A1S3HD92_LINAN|nr:uncharacterized protein LOC106153615 [Lingula anatina]|eukprot:XP_013383064.1 uncharacterized protein LOC106153615 [Lingula anatina]
MTRRSDSVPDPKAMGPNPEHYQAAFAPCVFVAVALILVTIGLGTDAWYRYATEANAVDTDPLHNREFGLWRTCFYNWPTGAMSRVKLVPPYLVCIDEVPETANSSNVLYSRMKGMVRVTMACVLASAGVLLLTLVVITLGYWRHLVPQVNVRQITWAAGGFSLLGGCLEMAGLISFIALRDMEQEGKGLGNSYYTSYGWSFIISWVGAIFAVLAGFTFFYVAYLMLLDYKYIKSITFPGGFTEETSQNGSSLAGPRV